MYCLQILTLYITEPRSGYKTLFKGRYSKMKIAKKMLACVMALALLGCFAVTAFAATPSVVAVPGKVDDGTVAVTIIAKNAVGLTSADVVLKYDPAVFEYSYAENAADADQIAGTKNNTFTADYNGEVSGEVTIGFYFKTSLTTTAEAVAQAKKGAVINYDENAFKAIVVYLDVIDAKAASSELALTGNFKTLTADANAVNAKATATLKEVPTTVAPTEAPTAAPTTVPTSDIPDTGDEPKTGDNAALAVAAGVVLLAGAAFVITKKRK